MIRTFDFLTELSKGVGPSTDAALARESNVFSGETCTVENMQEIERAAYEIGVFQGRQMACSECQALIGQAEQVREQEFRLRLESWSDAIKTRIDQQVDERIQAAEDKLAVTIVEILRPFLQTQYELKAVAELKDLLNDHLCWRERKSAFVRVPEHLISYFKDDLDSELKDCEFAPSPDIEVTIEFSETILRTQLTFWLKRLFSE